MPRSVSIHPDRKQSVEDALKRNGFLTQGDFAANIGKALSTVSNFFNAKKVAISTFEEICEELGLDKREIQRPLESSQDKAEKKTLPIIPTLYNPEKWVGRSQLIEKLLKKFQKNTCIVWLTGLSGIGKTTLGECIAVQAWENDPSFQWIHLEISASQLTDFATGAREILSQLGEKDLDPQEMNDPKRLSDRLLQKLQSSCYWLQIDALEKLISANEFIDSYWLTFFESCLNTNQFPSRLLLTSQVLPNTLINWCDRFSNIWYQETLKGLKNEESEQYFVKNGIITDESNQTILSDITQTYEGHPLVLQVITREILQVYQGDVTAYWQVNQAEFEQVSRELKSSRLTETDYNEQLARRVRERVKKSLEQLPETAIALLCRSAVYRRPVLKKFWLGLITEYSPKEQLEAYRILGDRALIEKEKNLIRLHNLVRDISYDWLREDEIIWKATEVKAAELWLSEYQPEKNAENLEKVRGYLEAFYHYCDADDWINAENIFKIRLQIAKTKELHNQLFTWGYYEQNFNLCDRLLNQIKPRINIICYKNLAQKNSILGRYEKAIEYCRKGAAIAQQMDEVDCKLSIDNVLGNIYNELERYEETVSLLISSLEKRNSKHKNIDDREMKLVIYKTLGNAYFGLNKIQEAIHGYQVSLNISQELNDSKSMAEAYLDIANVYGSLSKFEYAEKYIRKAQSFAEISEDYLTITNYKENLGLVLCCQDKYSEGLSLLEEALERFNKMGYLKRRMVLSWNLSNAYYKVKQLQHERKYREQALKIAKELDIPLAQECQELLSKIEEAENC
jgi:tetratricopeptide (TPR) repeat protein